MSHPQITLEKRQYLETMSLPRSQGDRIFFSYPYLDPVSTTPVRDQQTQECLPRYPSIVPDDPSFLSSRIIGENLEYASYNGLSTSVEELQAELSSASNIHRTGTDRINVSLEHARIRIGLIVFLGRFSTSTSVCRNDSFHASSACFDRAAKL